MKKNPDDQQLRDFGEGVFTRLREVPFGSLPKTELEAMLFSELVRSGIVDIDRTSNFELARSLRCSPNKSSNLVFNFRMREAPATEEATLEKLAEVTKLVKSTRSSNDGEVTLNVEDRYWRNELIDRLKQADIFTDTSFNRERIVLDEQQFYEACPELFGEAGEAIQQAMRKPESKVAKKLKELMNAVMNGAAGQAGGMAIAAIAAAIIP